MRVEEKYCFLWSCALGGSFYFLLKRKRIRDTHVLEEIWAQKAEAT